MKEDYQVRGTVVGTIFNTGFSVTPADGGSFVVTVGNDWRGNGIIPGHRGFTNVDDLMDWLMEQAHPLVIAEFDTSWKPGDIIRTPA